MIELLITLALVGLIAWVVIQVVPMPPAMRTAILGVALLIVLILVVRAFGLDVPTRVD